MDSLKSKGAKWQSTAKSIWRLLSKWRNLWKMLQNLQATQELEESRDQLRGIVEAVGEGIIAVDSKGKVICCNKAAAQILELGNTNPIGIKLKDIFPEAPILKY